MEEGRFCFFAELVATLLTVLTVCGCAGLSTRDVTRIFVDADPVDAAAVAKYWDGPRIGPGMVLVVQVGSATSVTKDMSVIVDQNGNITLPYLLQNPVACDGLGLEALRAKLAREYAKYIRQPQVTVTFGKYDDRNGVSPWGTVTVMGEVATPGPVNMPPTMDLTVTKVLQIAGGVKQFADKKNITVTRCDKNGKQSRTKVDLFEIGEDGRFDKDITLKAGDVIFVPETWY